jgi:hypothetical protein
MSVKVIINALETLTLLLDISGLGQKWNFQFYFSTKCVMELDNDNNRNIPVAFKINVRSKN